MLGFRGIHIKFKADLSSQRQELQATGVQLTKFVPLGDWTSWTSVLVLLVLALLTGVALSPFTALAALFLPGNAGLWFVVYCAVPLLLLIPGIDRAQTWLLARDTREPTLEEYSRIASILESVLVRIDRGRDRGYQLRVVDLDEVNAFAAGGNVVVVTTRALWKLPDRQLEAVLAHEMGHHIGMHPIILLFRAWLMYPISLIRRIALTIHNLVAFLTRFRMSWKVYLFLVGLVLILKLILVLFRVYLGALHYILMALGRMAEYRADRAATRLGLGNALIESLQSSDTEGSNVSYKPPLLDRWRNTHPPIGSRIDRIIKVSSKLPM